MAIREPDGVSGDYLYAQLVDRIRGLIEAGTLRAGDRLPSLRACASQQGVSLSTVLQAYRALEDRGLVEARPQSGFYIRRSRAIPLPEPTMPAPTAMPHAVRVSRMATRVCEVSLRSDVVPFGAAMPSPQLLPAKKLTRLLARSVRDRPATALTALEPLGLLELRVQIARRAFTAGRVVTPEQIVVTNGCLEALGLCLAVLTAPGDVVAVESPTYFGVLQVLERMGLRALEVPADGRLGIDLECLESAFRRRSVRACVVIPNGHNPLGYVMPDARKADLVALSRRYAVPLVEDDVYGELCFQEQRPKSLAAFDAGAEVLQCGSFSKTLAPGFRLGWIVAARQLEEIKNAKFATSIATTATNQMAVAAYLQRGGYDHHLRRLRRTCRENLKRMLEIVAHCFPDGTRVSRPEGGIVLWLELPAGVRGMRLYEAALERGISLAPGAMFSASGSYERCVRLNGALEWSARVDGALRIVGELVAEMASRNDSPAELASAK